MAKNNTDSPFSTTRKICVDTNFLMSLFNPNDSLHENAKSYFQALVEDGVELYISSIVWAELFGKKNFDSLDHFRFLPFRRTDAEQVWDIFDDQFWKTTESKNRSCIKDDYKILAQAISKELDAILTADEKFIKLCKNRVQCIDFRVSLQEYLGQLF